MAALSDRDTGGHFLPDFGLSERGIVARFNIGLRAYKRGMKGAADDIEDFENKLERFAGRSGKVSIRFYRRQASEAFKNREDIANNLADDLQKEARKVLRRTIPDVPVRTGRLRESGQVEDTHISARGKDLSVAITFDPWEPRGKGRHHYAFYVHETHPTKRKFLERHMVASQQSFARAIQKAILREIS